MSFFVFFLLSVILFWFFVAVMLSGSLDLTVLPWVCQFPSICQFCRWVVTFSRSDSFAVALSRSLDLSVFPRRCQVLSICQFCLGVVRISRYVSFAVVFSNYLDLSFLPWRGSLDLSFLPWWGSLDLSVLSWCYQVLSIFEFWTPPRFIPFLIVSFWEEALNLNFFKATEMGVTKKEVSLCKCTFYIILLKNGVTLEKNLLSTDSKKYVPSWTLYLPWFIYYIYKTFIYYIYKT